jgi:CRISPR-associated protein Csb2
VERIRDAAAERLRGALPDAHAAIERTLVGREVGGSDPSPPDERARIIPLPSIGHEHADHAVRRILLEIPSGAPVPVADLEWALSSLEPSSPASARPSPFLLTRTEDAEMLRHYAGPGRRWRSVTPVAVPEGARRRRIEPTRRREEAKPGSERIAEEARAVEALRTALRHAGVDAGLVAARVQREPFEARGTRVEPFAEGTRFSKERLWHVELELDRPVEGPLVLGDGRFLGLGVLAPVRETGAGERSSAWGIFALSVGDGADDAPLVLAWAFRRAVLARAQAEIGSAALGTFFTGHDTGGGPARGDASNHLAFHWDGARRRLLVIAPHWLDRRAPSSEERRHVDVLGRALEDLLELRAGPAGRFGVRLTPVDEYDPLLVAVRTWMSATPYAVTRHKKRSTAAEVLLDDVVSECQRRGLPRPTVTVLDARGVAGRGLEGRLRLDFNAAVSGPIVLGRTRYLGGGLFVPGPA